MFCPICWFSLLGLWQSSSVVAYIVLVLLQCLFDVFLVPLYRLSSPPWAPQWSRWCIVSRRFFEGLRSRSFKRFPLASDVVFTTFCRPQRPGALTKYAKASMLERLKEEKGFKTNEHSSFGVLYLWPLLWYFF